MPSATLNRNDTASAAVAADSAAQKVFALPELLAEILLHMSTFPNDSTTTAFIGGHPRPETDLFVLQRVNKTFQATILRSVALRRCMFLASYPGWMGTVWPRHAVDWLLDVVGVVSEGGGERISNALSIRVYSPEVGLPEATTTAVQDREPREFRAYGKTAEASWRNIKAHCLEGDSVIELRGLSWEGWVTLRSVSPEENLTLGQVHDGLQRVMPFLEDWRDASDELHDVAGWGDEVDDARLKRVGDTLKRLEEVCARDETWR